MAGERIGRRGSMRLRRMSYSLGWLTAMAVALGAPWKNSIAIFDLF
jgi:hypothetical protein